MEAMAAATHRGGQHHCSTNKERGRACANGPDDQYTDSVPLTSRTRSAPSAPNGRVTARFWWARDAVEAGYAKLRTTVVAGFP